MNVLILGANGMLGPHVIKALEDEHRLRLTDVNELKDTPHEYYKLDVSDLDQVIAAADGMDAIVNLSVLRLDRRLAFDVSARGCYNMMAAAVRHGIRRVVNTGPFFATAGADTYERFDYGLEPDVPPQPGTLLYALTKSLGLETCRVFSENHDLYVLTLLFYHFAEPDDQPAGGQDFVPFTVTWSDAAEALRPCLALDLDSLPSRCETFNIFADVPHGKFSNERAKRVLGWRPRHRLEQFWRKGLVDGG